MPAATAPQCSPSTPPLEDCGVISEPMWLSKPRDDVPPDLLGEGAGDDDLVDGFWLLVAEEAGLIGLEFASSSAVRRPVSSS